MKKFYITTAIDYVNSSPHIGTAYEKIGADVIARWCRLNGIDVRFQMGNDEHSINVFKSAKAKNIDVKKYCDDMRIHFENIWKTLNISYDDFIQTSEERHKKAVINLFAKIQANDDVYKAKYNGFYCESCEAYVTEKDLVDGMCERHKQKPKVLSEENYFFALSKYAKKLKKHIDKNPEFILPETRRNEILNVIKDGLEDISISREGAGWGISFPNDETQKVYVWFDALINYISAVGYGSNESEFDKWWPADMHVIGKDITRFHCLIWPAMLMSAGLKLPKTIFAHGFVSLKGEKMSKTLGNVVNPLDVAGKYGADTLRFYLMREGSFGRDSDFTWEQFLMRYNGDLANGLGNVVSRTTGMIGRYFNGKIKRNKKSFKIFEEEFNRIAKGVRKNLDWKEGDIAFHNALALIWEGMSLIDRHINDKKPWELAKQNKTDELLFTLQAIMEGLGRITVLLIPFMPETSKKIWNALGWNAWCEFDKIQISDNDLVSTDDGEFKTTQVALFPRIDNITEEVDINKKQESGSIKNSASGTVTSVQADSKGVIKMEDGLLDITEFMKVDLKIAKVKHAEKIEGADKLLKVIVDLGTEERQIVAGIAKHYEPENLIGKLVVVVTNLKPAKLRGVESNGMLLATTSGEQVIILTPEKEALAGSKVK